MFHDRIAEARFAELQKQYRFHWCIETGTHMGIGAFRASNYCNVVTIDTNSGFIEQAKANWVKAGCQQIPYWPVFRHGEKVIASIRGNSPSILREILGPESGPWDHPICFYLDAHWEEHWPLLDELKIISDLDLSDSVIIIHDVKVPGTDFNYDSYGGQDLNYEYVKDSLARINPNYRIEYNDKCDPRDEPYSSARGILYALP